MNNIKLFIGLAIVLGITLIVTEVGLIVFGFKPSEDQVTSDQIISLPPSYDDALIGRYIDREKYLLLSPEQFEIPLAQTIPTTTPTPTITPSASPTPIQ
jgi:hypothetical protein